MLPYYSAFQVTSGAGNAGSYVFSANGLYDPDITSTGGQPSGFDQMMVFYQHYTVFRSKMTIAVKNQTSGVFASCSLAARADNTVVNSIETIMENGNCVFTKLSTGFLVMKELAMTIDISRFCGCDDLMDEHDSRGSVSSNPVEQTYFHVSTWNSETVASVNVWVEARIEYYAVFSEPRVIDPSSLKRFVHALKVVEEKSAVVH